MSSDSSDIFTKFNIYIFEKIKRVPIEEAHFQK